MDLSTYVEVPLLELEFNKQKTINSMDSKFYNAATEGQIDAFNSRTEPLNLLLTPTKNTILHVHITQQQKGANISLSFIEQILAKCPSLLLQTNSKGETPLHSAARHGHDKVVRFLIDSAKAKHQDIESGTGAARAMLRKENMDKETALHVAVRHNNPVVVQILTDEDPDFMYLENRSGETPLYLAIERGHNEMVLQMLDTCTSLAYHGPNGRTALHEAVIRNNSEIAAKIVLAKKSLEKEVDQQGWTPLHHASYFGFLSIVNLLLEYDESVAYIGDKDGMTPLHLAVACGDSHQKVVFSILEHCPDCHELVDHKGRNVLHIAVQSNSMSLISHFLKLSDDNDYDYIPLMTNLLNIKDVDGNTPLHYLATCCFLNFLMIQHPLVDRMVVNDNNSTPMDVISKNTDDISAGNKGFTMRIMNKAGYMPGLKNFIEVNGGSPKVINTDKVERTKTSHMIVAALVATITFTAGFTMPGGFGDNGIAIMSTNGAFVTFVITDALALLLSTCALFFYYCLEHDELADRKKENYVNVAALCIMVSIFLMLVAFTAAIFAVLPSTYLKILVCIISSFSLVICYSPLKFLFTH